MRLLNYLVEFLGSASREYRETLLPPIAKVTPAISRFTYSSEEGNLNEKRTSPLNIYVSIPFQQNCLSPVLL